MGIKHFFEKVTTNQTSDTIPVTGVPNVKSLQATVRGTGALTADVDFQARNQNGGWVSLATVTLAGSTEVSDAVTIESVYTDMRAVLSNLTGTGAEVDASMTFPG